MAGEPQPAQKRPRLPFKPPSRTAASAGPSSTPKTKSKAKQASMKASTSTSTSKASASKASKGKTTAAEKRPRAESPPSDATSQSGSESESDESSQSRSRSVSQEPDYILAEITHSNPVEDVTSSEPTIPAKLLTRLLHQHFQNEKTKVAKDANGVVAKYVDVFVREAIARAAYERAETDGISGGRRVGDGFLEVYLPTAPTSHSGILTDQIGGRPGENGTTTYDGFLAFESQLMY